MANANPNPQQQTPAKSEEKKKETPRSEAGKALDKVYDGLGGGSKALVVTGKYVGAAASAPVHAGKHAVWTIWDCVKVAGRHIVETGEDVANTARYIDTQASVYLSEDEKAKEQLLLTMRADAEGARADCGMSENDVIAMIASDGERRLKAAAAQRRLQEVGARIEGAQAQAQGS
jgi:hypothetical protein